MRRAARLGVSLTIALAACDGEAPSPTDMTDIPEAASQRLSDNPQPESWGPIPGLDLSAYDFPVVKSFAPGITAGGLTPGSLSATLNPGETVIEHKTADISAGSAAGDVLFAFDLTGSMGGELSNVKANAVNIMSAVSGVIADVQFGLTSHMDYPGFFSTSIAAGQACNYSNTYGSAAFDLPYILNQTVTSNQATVATAINAMSLGSGVDGPESYSTILYESYAELAGETNPTEGPIGWRTGSKKIVVAFGDNVPHDCDYNAIIGGTSDTGHEPGRDNTVGTADDLHILDVLDGMAANNVTLINLHSGNQNVLWDAYANVTGGLSFQINSNGTFPGGVAPEDKIAELIEDEVSMVDELTLEICPAFSPTYDPWIVSVTPPSHTGLTLPAVETFDLELGPPLGTAPGVYTFDVCLIGDGAEFGRQTVDITVPDDDPPVGCDPLALLDDLGSLIDDYVEDGIIPAWARTMLMGFVENARTALIVGNREGPNPVRAGREMRHLMGIILASIADHRVSEEDAQPLIDAATAVNECLGQPTRPKPPHEEEPTGPPAPPEECPVTDTSEGECPPPPEEEPTGPPAPPEECTVTDTTEGECPPPPDEE